MRVALPSIVAYCTESQHHTTAKRISMLRIHFCAQIVSSRSEEAHLSAALLVVPAYRFDHLQPHITASQQSQFFHCTLF